jgi:hypothetical protein
MRVHKGLERGEKDFDRGQSFAFIFGWDKRAIIYSF